MKDGLKTDPNNAPSTLAKASCQCHQIKLKRFLTRSSIRGVWNGDGSKRIYRFEPAQEVSENSECPLCRLLATSCNEAAARGKVEVLSWYSYGAGRTLKDSFTSIFGFEIDTKTSLRILPLGDDAHLFGRMPTNLGRRLEGNIANRRLMRGWLDRCVKTHEQCRDLQKRIKDRSRGPKRLLNTRTKVLESVRVSRRYFALSYVWGEASKEIMEQLSAMSWNTTEQSVSHLKLPRGVQDAIQLTKDLGETYLWVDFLCINQNDSQEKLIEIAQMNEIYLSATMTIIALSSDNANSPIPGVNEYQPRRKQCIEEWEGVRLTTIYPSASDIYSQPGCKWNTRAWTMQEHLLSRRILFMGPKQVYFSCGTATYSEDRYEFDNDIYQMHHHPGKLLLDPSREYRSVPWQLWKKYTELFSTRRCTVETDRYPAFQGVLNEQRASWDMASVAGVPLKHLPLCLLWWHGPKREAYKSSRIGSYPSWSWIGWSGEVNFPLPKRYQTKIKEFKISTTSSMASLQYGKECNLLDEPKTKTEGTKGIPLLPITNAHNSHQTQEETTSGTDVKPALVFSTQYIQLTAHACSRSDGLLSIYNKSRKTIGLIDDPSCDHHLHNELEDSFVEIKCILLGVSAAREASQSYYLPTETEHKKPVGLRYLVRDPLTTPDDRYNWLYSSNGGRRLSNTQLGGMLIEPQLPEHTAPLNATWSQKVSATARRILSRSPRILSHITKQLLTFLLWLILVPLGVVLYGVYVGITYVLWRNTQMYHTAHLLWVEEVSDGVYERRGIGEMKYSELEKLKSETRRITLI